MAARDRFGNVREEGGDAMAVSMFAVSTPSRSLVAPEVSLADLGDGRYRCSYNSKCTECEGTGQG